MPTLNNKLRRVESSLAQLRDDFDRRAKGIEKHFPEESEKLYKASFGINQILESVRLAQNDCNLGDRFEIFNK